ncbi:MAG: SpoIID/LytB domain-containing protein [Planctomycetota bacterium]|nr:SpoIID/LytB domain-containing protein [Planctomycetota bacterium]
MSNKLGVVFVVIFSALAILLAQVFTIAPPTPDVVNPLLTVKLKSLSRNDSLPLQISGRWQLIDSKTDEVLIERDNFQGDLVCDITGPKLGPYAANRDKVYLHCDGEDALRLDYFSYPGELIIEAERNKLNQYHQLNLYLRLRLEDYVLGVICGELPSQTPDIGAALEAQSIAARTYAIFRIQQGKRLRADSRDQVYIGSDQNTWQAKDAVHATRGLVLSEDGVILPSYFHSNCGGGTANSFEADFSKTKLSALAGSTDPQCGDVYQRWQHTVPVARLDKLSAEFNLGDTLQALNTVSKDIFQRRLVMRLQGENGHHDLSGEHVRIRLGLPSMIWHGLIINRDGSITITGSGNGHGIGFCQEGAMRQAKQGLDYAAILQHYYPGVEVEALTANLFNQ